MVYPVPFFGNTLDDTHCFQASLRMVLAYFEPTVSFSWQELDEVTGKVAEKWTWPMQTLLWLQERGYEIHDIEVFDYAQFAERGEAYLVQEYGEDVARAQKEHSDIHLERFRARTFVERISYDKRIPSLEDVRQFLEKGFLQILNINAHALNGKTGYGGHTVLAIGYDQDGLILHDPGLPHQPSRHVPYDIFMKAWAYPTVSAQNIIALRYTIPLTR